MDIDDAFTETVITAVGELDGVEATALEDVIKQIYTTNDLPFDDNEIRVGVLCFAAGRAYQEDLSSPAELTVTLPTSVWKELIELLLQRGTA